MGKKARKTRWRTLSIGEGPSDTESQSGEGAKPQGPRGRWGQGGGVSGPQQRYNSSHSTPTRHPNHRQYHMHNGGDSGAKWVPGGRALHANASTRSSSTASENKITFNEDEYTKITTPRQDVLFKKGYLSKPKPHLQRPLTSAGNSTGDGTPDHQSADGTDYPENDFDAVFPYPGGAYDPSMYYLNTFDPLGPNTVQPVLLYDQFGNAALCYPHAGLHPTYQPHNARGGPPGAKRYSVDSLAESPSPNNDETCSAETETEETEEVEEVFEGAQAFPVEEDTSDTKPVENGDESENEEKKLRKKRRRRKTEEETEEKTSEEVEEEVKVKYSVDAEEFIPRGFAPEPQLSFMPLVPHEIFPGGFVLMPAPPQWIAAPPPPPVELEEEVGGPVGPIDIAKIVSKLEQAAREQKQELQEFEENKEDKIEPEDKMKDKTEANEDGGSSRPEVELELPTELPQEVMNKTEKQSEKIPEKLVLESELNTNKTEVTRPAVARYADRLKTHQPPTRKTPTPAPVQATPLKQRLTPPNKSRAVPVSSSVCPRLERTATASKPSPVALPVPKTPPTTSDWISVSGKKKRKSNQKQLDMTSSTSSISPISPAAEVSPVGAPPPETSPSAPVLPLTTPEVVAAQSGPPTIEKTPKSKTTKSMSKKLTKKRIIITDGALGVPKPPLIDAPCSPAPLVLVEQAANSNLGENNKIIENKEPELPECLELPDTSPTPETHQTAPITPISVTPEAPKQSETTTKKHKKKNKNKSKLSGSSCDLGLIGADSPACEASVDSVSSSGAPLDDDMSLELDRMIQRGLYANLEQKLQNFNPGDSFLATLGRSAPALAPNLFSKPPPSLLSFPPLILPPQASSAKSEDSETSPNPTGATPTGPQGPQGLSITQAVRDWMDRTREATPEVEIFRRPQELRQEVLLAIEDLEIGSEEDLDLGSLDSVASEPETAEDDLQVDRTALDAASLLDDRPRSRSGSVDLLQCWEYDVQPPAQPMLPVDPAEDALESYESVYGQNLDFQRIQSEVLGLRPRPRARGDGGLPYRAICCTVM